MNALTFIYRTILREEFRHLFRGIFSMGILLFLIIYVGIAFLIIRKSSPRIDAMEFNKVMINALNLGTVRDVNDVVNIYKGLQRDSADDYDFRADMSRYLRRLLVALVNRDGVANDVDDKKINIWKYWVTEIIKKNEELAPFAGLPEAEKNILNDSVAFLDKGDHDAVRRKFSELVGVIKTRNEEFERNRLLNSLSIPLSIVGIILTIVFGVIGSISFFRTSSHKQSTA